MRPPEILYARLEPTEPSARNEETRKKQQGSTSFIQPETYMDLSTCKVLPAF